MDHEICSLKSRMAAGGDWKEFRDEIVRLHSKANTEDEYVALMEAWHNLVAVGRYSYDEETYVKLLPITHAEYLNFLNKESLRNGVIDPVQLEKVTRREVAAGRLNEVDGFRQLAVAGSDVLGNAASNLVHQYRSGSWFFYGGATAGVVGAGLSQLGLSPYWAVAICFLVGWLLNEREKRRKDLS